MISQDFSKDLPFSGLDPLQSVLIVAGMFLKYKPDHSVLSTSHFEYLQHPVMTSPVLWTPLTLVHLIPGE